MISKVIAVIVSVIIAFLSSFSFSAYADFTELDLTKNTVYSNPTKKFALPGLGNVDIVGIVQYVMDKTLIDAGTESPVIDGYVIYGKKKLAGTEYNIFDGLAEIILYTDTDLQTTDYSFGGAIVLTGTNNFDGVYPFRLIGQSRRFTWSGYRLQLSGTYIFENYGYTGTFNNFFFYQSTNNNLPTRSWDGSQDITLQQLLQDCMVGNSSNNFYYMVQSYSNDYDFNYYVNGVSKQSNKLPFLHLSNNIFQANQKISRSTYMHYLDNKFTELQNVIVQPYKNNVDIVYNNFPEANTPLANPVTFNPIIDFSVDLNSLVPIVSPPAVGGGGGVPSDWLETYPPIDMTPEFSIDDSDMQHLVNNVDVAPLKDSFLLFNWVSDFFSDLGILNIFLTIIVVGIICRFIF